MSTDDTDDQAKSKPDKKARLRALVHMTEYMRMELERMNCNETLMFMDLLRTALTDELKNAGA